MSFSSVAGGNRHNFQPCVSFNQLLPLIPLDGSFLTLCICTNQSSEECSSGASADLWILSAYVDCVCLQHCLVHSGCLGLTKLSTISPQFRGLSGFAWFFVPVTQLRNSPTAELPCFQNIAHRYENHFLCSLSV